MAFKKVYIDCASLDDGIFELCNRIDLLPYVTLRETCEGHYYERMSPPHNYIADPGQAFIFDGFLFLNVNSKAEKRRELLRLFRTEASKHQFTSFEYRPEVKAYCFRQSCQDLIQPFSEEDIEAVRTNGGPNFGTLEKITKIMHQVPLETAQIRKTEYDLVWQELNQAFIEFTRWKR